MSGTIYEVPLPNGTIVEVENVTSEDAARARARLYFQQSDPQGYAAWAAQQPAAGFGERFVRGVDEFQGRLYGAAEAVGAATGIESLEQFGRRGVQRNVLEAEQSSPEARLRSFGEAEGIGGVLRAGQQAIAGSAPEVPLPLAGALAGARLGSVAGLPGTLIGGALGAALGSYPSLVGGNVEAQRAEAARQAGGVEPESIPAPGTALAAAVPQALIGGVFDVATLRLARILGVPAAEVGRNLLPRIMRGLGYGAITEMPEEVLQTAIQRAQAGQPVLGDDAMRDYFEAAAGGFFVGAAFGGTAAGAFGRRPPAAAPPPPPDTGAPAGGPPAPEPVLPPEPAPITTPEEAADYIRSTPEATPQVNLQGEALVRHVNAAQRQIWEQTTSALRTREIDDYVGTNRVRTLDDGRQDFAGAADTLLPRIYEEAVQGNISLEQGFTVEDVTNAAMQRLGVEPTNNEYRRVRNVIDGLVSEGYLSRTTTRDPSGRRQSTYSIGLRNLEPLRQMAFERAQQQAAATVEGPTPVVQQFPADWQAEQSARPTPQVARDPNAPTTVPQVQPTSPELEARRQQATQAFAASDPTPLLQRLAADDSFATSYLDNFFSSMGRNPSQDSIVASTRQQGLILTPEQASAVYARGQQLNILNPLGNYDPPARRAEKAAAKNAAVAKTTLNQVAATGQPATISPQVASNAVAQVETQQATEDLARAAAAPPAPPARPAGFTTARGSTYEINEVGQTIRTKRSEGPGQGTTYPPHNVLYVTPEQSQDILAEMRGFNRYRFVIDDNGTTRTLQPGETIGNRRAGIAIVRPDGSVDQIIPAQTTPAVGLSPVELAYEETPEGFNASRHIGNPITELRGQPASPPPEPTFAAPRQGPSSARTPEQQAEAAESFERVTGGRGRLSFAENLFLRDLDPEVQRAAADAGIEGPIAGYAVGDLAVLSLADSTMPLNQVAIHEGYHVAENIGLIKSNDIALLDASRNDILNAIRRDLDFVADPDSLAPNEVRAYGANARLSRGTDFGPLVNRIFDRLANLVGRLRNFVQGRGFRTWRDVYDEFLSGRTATLSTPGEATLGYEPSVSFAELPKNLQGAADLRAAPEGSTKRALQNFDAGILSEETTAVLARRTSPEGEAYFKDLEAKRELWIKADSARNMVAYYQEKLREPNLTEAGIFKLQRRVTGAREKFEAAAERATTAGVDINSPFPADERYTIPVGSFPGDERYLYKSYAPEGYPFNDNRHDFADPLLRVPTRQVDFAAPRPISTAQQGQQATQQYFEHQIRGPSRWFSSLDLTIAKDRPVLRPTADNMVTGRRSNAEAKLETESLYEEMARLPAASQAKVLDVWQTASMTQKAPVVTNLDAREQSTLQAGIASVQRAFDWLVEAHVIDYFTPSAKMTQAEQSRLKAFWARNDGKHLWEIPAAELRAASPQGFAEFQRLNKMRNPYKLPAIAEGTHFVAVYKKNARGDREGKPLRMIAYTPPGFLARNSNRVRGVAEPETVARAELQRQFPDANKYYIMQRGQEFTLNSAEAQIRNNADLISQYLSGVAALPAVNNSTQAKNLLNTLIDRLDKAQLERVFRSTDNVLQAVSDINRDSYAMDAVPRYLLGVASIQARRRTQSAWTEAIKPLTASDQKWLNDLRDYAYTPTEAFGGLRTFTFFYLLGFAPDSALVNALQTLQVTMPMMIRDGGVGAIRHFGRATREAMRASDLAARDAFRRGSQAKGVIDYMGQALTDPAEKAAYGKAVKAGTLAPLFTNESRGQVSIAGLRNAGIPNPVAWAKRANTVARWAGGMQQYVEQTARAATFLAAYRAAVANPQIISNKNRIDNLQLQTPYDYATSVVDDTHYAVGREDRALYQRFTPLAEPATQFMSFVTKTIEIYLRQARLAMRGVKEGDLFMAKAGSVGLLAMTAPVVALAGIWALPGADFLKEAYEALVKEIWGTTQNLDADMKRAAGGGYWGEVMTRGFPAAHSFVNLSRRLSLDPVSFSDLFGGQVISLFGGPSLAPAEGLIKTYNYLQQGDLWNAAAAFMPRAVGNVIKGADLGFGTGSIRSQRGYTLLSPEAVAEIDAQQTVGGVAFRQAVGFPAPEISSLREALVRKEEMARQLQTVTQRFNNEAARYLTEAWRAQQNGDNERASRFFRQFDEAVRERAEANDREFNRNRPDLAINFNMRAIQQRAYEDLVGRTSEQAGMRGVPQNIRPRVMEERALYDWRALQRQQAAQ